MASSSCSTSRNWCELELLRHAQRREPASLLLGEPTSSFGLLYSRRRAPRGLDQDRCSAYRSSFRRKAGSLEAKVGFAHRRKYEDGPKAAQLTDAMAVQARFAELFNSAWRFFVHPASDILPRADPDSMLILLNIVFPEEQRLDISSINSPKAGEYSGAYSTNISHPVRDSNFDSLQTLNTRR